MLYIFPMRTCHFFAAFLILGLAASPWAGKLSDFENKVGSDNNSSSNEDDDCGFLCSLLQALFSDNSSDEEEDEPETEAKDSVHAANSFSEPTNSISEPAPTASAGFLTPPPDWGDPLFPKLEIMLGQGWQDETISSDQLNINLGNDIFMVGMGIRTYTEELAAEDTTTGSLTQLTVDFGIRIPLSRALRLDLIYGLSGFKGGNGQTGSHFTIATRGIPMEHIALFTSGTLHSYEDSWVYETEFGVEAHIPYVAIRGGYHLLGVSGELLAGPFVAVVLRL